MSKIKIENISHSYKQGDKQHDTLSNINLTIEKGELLVILGESGCGKTTFLNILAGLLTPAAGSVWIDDNRYKVNRPHFSRSLITQQPYLLPWLNVKENIMFGCKLRNDLDDLSNRVNKFLKFMGLESFKKAYPKSLSLGMAQRVAFARSLISTPEILLFDEPFTSLDFYNRSRLQVELLRIWQKEKYTMIFVTHDIEEAILLGQRIVMFGNSPSTIEHIFNVDEPYPRDLKDRKIFDLKIDIQNKFKEILDFKW